MKKYKSHSNVKRKSKSFGPCPLTIQYPNNQKSQGMKTIEKNIPLKDPLHRIHTEIKEIKKIIKNTEASNNKLSNILIKSANINIAKESLVMALREELNHHNKLHNKLLEFKSYADKVTKRYKKNRDDILKYKNRLRNDLSEFVKLLDNYDNQEKACIKENENLHTINQSIIKNKKQYQNELLEKINKLDKDTNKQNDDIDELRNVLREFRNYNNNYMSGIDKNESEHDYRYQKLLKAYKRVENEYIYYYNLEMESRKNQLDGENSLYKEEENGANLRLAEKKVRNQFLQNMVQSIKMQIEEIEEQKRNFMDDEELIRFLGKTGAMKYKKRMGENYTKTKSDIGGMMNRSKNSITSNY